MDTLEKYTGSCFKEEGSRRIFQREIFMKQLGSELYRGLRRGDLTGRYQKVYSCIQGLQGKPTTIEPAPRSLKELGDKVTDDALQSIECDLAALLEINASMGMGLVASSLKAIYDHL